MVTPPYDKREDWSVRVGPGLVHPFSASVSRRLRDSPAAAKRNPEASPPLEMTLAGTPAGSLQAIRSFEVHTPV